MTAVLWSAFRLCQLLAHHVMRLSRRDAGVAEEIGDALDDFEQAIKAYERE